MEQEFLKLENLSKTIKKREIIHDFSLNIREGEVFGLVGVNGAGKTTIMRMITGLIKPTKGQVFIEGKNISEHSEPLGQIGAIIEGPDLYKHLSGYLNLKIAANMYENVSEERIFEVAELLGIKDRLKDKVKTYSLGMRQRLAIAMAILNHPKLLVFDEPLNGLDPQGVREVRTIMHELAKNEKVTVIISSHILSEMELICDRICIIDKGSLVEVKEIGESESKKQQCEFEFMNEYNITELEAIIKEFEIEIIKTEPKKLVLKLEEEERLNFIKKIVKEDYSLISVIPMKVSLEEYFVDKVGEKS